MSLQPKYRLGKRSTSLLLSIIAALVVLALGMINRQEVAKVLEAHQPGLYLVTKVDDGDTLTVNMGGKTERVRMIGVDTPELHHPEKPVQCFAQAASNFTSELIGNNTVRLEADPLDDNRDLYGRLLRYVYLPDGTLVNLEIIQHGYGFVYTRFPYRKMGEFRAAEQTARQANLGLWAGCRVTDNGTTKETNPN